MRSSAVVHILSGKSFPVLQPHQDHIHSQFVGPQQAGWIQQLLKHLVIRRKFNRHRELQFLHQERQRLRERFGSEGRGNRNPL